MNEQNKTYRYAISAIFSFLMFIFFLAFFSSFRNIPGAYIWNDYNVHISEGEKLIDSYKSSGLDGILKYKNESRFAYIIGYPLWHLLQHMCNYLLAISGTPNIVTGADLANTILCTVMGICVLGYINKGAFTNSIVVQVGLLILSFLLLVLGPLNASHYLGRYYLGAFSPNPWHNPTYLMCRPLGFLAFVSYANLLEWKEQRNSCFFVSSVLLLLSGLCKPVTYQIMLPTITVICIIKYLLERTRKQFIYCCKMAISCIPSAIMAVLQMNIIPADKGSRIGIGLFTVWAGTHFTRLLSLGCSILFPAIWLLLSWFDSRKIRKDFLFAWCLFFVALFEWSLFYIPIYPGAGDFAWGVLLAIFFLFVTAAQEWAEYVVKGKKNWKWIVKNGVLVVTFMSHVYTGILYMWIIYTVGNPLIAI